MEGGEKLSASKIVSSVIHEYDVISEDEPDNISKTVTETLPVPIPDAGNSGRKSPAQISSRHRLSSSDRSNTAAEDKLPIITCPRVNCTEKIIFCVDASAEMEKLTFRSRAGDKRSPLYLTKKGLAMFLNGKQKLDKKHEYALMFMQDVPIWIRDFTHNPKDILVALEDLIDPPYCETCDMTAVFDKISDKVELPHLEGNPEVVPPPFVVRLIFIYGRSHCLLEFSKTESFKILNSSPHFFLDALYLHEPPSEENKCQEVFDTVCDLDRKGLSYILGASRNPTKVFDSMAQMMAHPLQRPPQIDAAYRIGSSIPLPENG